MFVKTDVSMTKRKNGEIVITIANVEKVVTTTDKNYSAWHSVYGILKSAYNRGDMYDSLVARGSIPTDEESEGTPVEVVELSDDDKIMQGLTDIIKFFSEFEFEPNFRFINTLSYRLAESTSSAKSYINNYFALIDNSYANEVRAKVKSKEFENILNNLKLAKPTTTVNNRFEIYYGSAGTGKTTKAMAESDNRCIVCNASMLPSDLMEDFIFVDGKPSFKPSEFWECMTNGKPIVLDEINLLPFESLRFLQGVLDGKKEFVYKGHTVTIADGFKVMGTMNLKLSGMTYGLPEPLVDRSANIVEFKLTPNQLLSALS